MHRHSPAAAHHTVRERDHIDREALLRSPTVLAAPDKFRGTATAHEAAAAIAAGAARAGWHAVELPLADGGEGTLDVLGGGNRVTRVCGPLGEPVEAAWRLDGKTAVIEMARASGLQLAGGRQRNDPEAATTFGTGELIATALRAGARTIVVALGGSATTDGGLGALEALGALVPFDAGVHVRVACDVTTPFVDAAAVFSPQKGATGDQVERLRDRLEGLIVAYRDRFSVDVASLPRAGAAGGLAGGLAAAGAELEDGFSLVAELAGLDRTLARVDLAITGEGRLDATSFAGKVVGGVAARSRSAQVGCFAVVGEADSAARNLLEHTSLTARFGFDAAMHDTAGCITRAVMEHLAHIARRRSQP